MLFTEARFLLFFALIFGVHWLLRRNGWRKAWLLLASYAFYAAWDWRFLSLIAISTATDYIAGSALGRCKPPSRRRAWLIGSLAINLGLLCAFKYFNFFIESGSALLEALGIPATPFTLEIVLPLGISFYTFQSLSYTIDIYRGQIEPVRNPLDFALFVGFFPQLVAGPIVRASEFLPQLRTKRTLGGVPVRACLTLFLFGFIKKACVADHCALYVDPIFADPQSFSMLSQWLAASLYGIQVYCDFSGYSDMAIATAGLLGYRLPENFRFPYLASSLTLCWRRWHMTLTRWFRDYLYIPLGGNRAGRPRTYANMILVFALCGLWHGASWNYVVFGLFHGVFLVFEHMSRLGRTSDRWHPLGNLYTLAVWIVALAIFRTPDLATAFSMVGNMLGFGAETFLLAPAELVWLAFLAGFAVVQAIMYLKIMHRPMRSVPGWIFGPIYGASVALALAFANAGYTPFIYFQF